MEFLSWDIFQWIIIICVVVIIYVLSQMTNILRRIEGQTRFLKDRKVQQDHDKILREKSKEQLQKKLDSL